jgi:hypothetical protein
VSKLDMLSAANAFLRADIEYVRLIQQAVDFPNKGTNHISPAELRAIRTARSQRATLEEQMFKVWDLSNDEE